jgi:hypothetical protein
MISAIVEIPAICTWALSAKFILGKDSEIFNVVLR